MTLRRRLVVTCLATLLPMVITLLWVDGRARHRAARRALADFTFMYMSSPGERERCETEPAQWGGEPVVFDFEPPPHVADHPPDDGLVPPQQGGAPPILYAYDSDFRGHHPRAPTVEADVLAAIDGHHYVPVTTPWYSDRVLIFARVPGDNRACAYLLAEGTTVRGWLGAILPATPYWLTPVLAMLAAVLVAVGPVIRRIRRLTSEVRRSSASGYVASVDVRGTDEVGELALAFNGAADAVQQQLAEKDRREQALRSFIADTTHDLRIPLTVLHAYLARMREAWPEPSDTSADVVAAMNEAHYIGGLIENLALVAELDSTEPRVDKGPVDLIALVERVMSRQRPIARQLEIAIDAATPEPPFTVDADVTMLEQAVSNLVHNAIRHNRPQGHVAVTLEHESSGGFRLVIADDGPGLAPAELERLMARGLRGEQARSRAPDGRGLGLPIAARVAQLHGFELRFARGEEGGLRATLRGG